MSDRRKLHGWKHVAGSVYDHVSGMRLHLLGMVIMPNGDVVHWGNQSQWTPYYKAVLLQGENRKRAMMKWALIAHEEKEKANE